MSDPDDWDAVRRSYDEPKTLYGTKAIAEQVWQIIKPRIEEMIQRSQIVQPISPFSMAMGVCPHCQRSHSGNEPCHALTPYSFHFTNSQD